MDNTVFPPPFPRSLVIKLDPLQYTFYQKSRLEIHSPSGQVLTAICKPLPAETADDAAYQVYCQTLLLEVLFYEANERIKFPPQAINGIARVIKRIDEYLKKQTTQ